MSSLTSKGTWKISAEVFVLFTRSASFLPASHLEFQLHSQLFSRKTGSLLLPKVIWVSMSFASYWMCINLSLCHDDWLRLSFDYLSKLWLLNSIELKPFSEHWPKNASRVSVWCQKCKRREAGVPHVWYTSWQLLVIPDRNTVDRNLSGKTGKTHWIDENRKEEVAVKQGEKRRNKLIEWGKQSINVIKVKTETGWTKLSELEACDASEHHEEYTAKHKQESKEGEQQYILGIKTLWHTVYSCFLCYVFRQKWQQ